MHSALVEGEFAMYQVSEKLDKVISGSGRTFVANIGGIQSGFQKVELSSMSTADSYFDIGSAVSTKLTVSMYNTTSNEFVVGKEVEFKIGANIGGTVEWVPMGLYTIDEANKERNLLTFTAYDRIGAKLSGTYISTITTYPAESRRFLADISAQTGVTFDTSNLTDTINIDRIVTIDDQSGKKTYKKPFDGYTMQQVVGYIAMLHSKFAICDRSGNIVFKWYAKSTYTVNANRYYDDLAKAETQCAITGIICITEKGQIKSGDDANLTLTNPVMTKEWLDNILTHVTDLAYYPTSFTCMGDPRLDVGDSIQVVNSTGMAIDVPIMQHTLTFDGGLLSGIANYGFATTDVQSPTDIALQRIKDDMLALQESTAQKITVDQLNVTNSKVQNVQEMVETSVATVTVEYYKSTSTTALSGGSWSTEQPTWEDGKYIWTRNKTTSNAGAITYSTAVCITGNTGATGAKGDTGATGKGVKSIVPQYYLSTSSTTQAGGTWTTTQPSWQPEHYMWTRSYITWSDNTTSTTTPILAQALNDANQKGYDNAQNLEAVKETVTKQGSSLETMENQIKEKVWKTDITTALEPVQENIDTAQSTADTAITVTTQNTNEIESLKTSTESITTALSSYTKTTEFEEYKKEVSSQLSQTPEAITARFTTLEETISRQGDDSNDKWKQLETYIRFGADGITIGKTDDPLTLTIDNGQICFMQSGQKVAWFTNNKLYVSNVETTTMAMLVGLKITKNGTHIQIS